MLTKITFIVDYIKLTKSREGIKYKVSSITYGYDWEENKEFYRFAGLERGT